MQLVLGLKGLPGAEMGLVKTILKLGSSLQASWTVAEGDACDVLLLGDVDDVGDAVSPSPRTTVVNMVRRGGVGLGPCLHRPIRAEELIDLLNAEGSRRGGRARAGEGVDGEKQLARLHRWPPFTLLEGRPAHLRLATLLSKQPLSAARLSALAARPLAECEAFIRELDAHRLLVWQASPPAAAGVPVAHGPAATHAPERSGLLGTLRRKLGIARNQA